MTATEKLLGKGLNVPVHAALVTPGIWRDKGNPHEALSLEDAPGRIRMVSFGPGKCNEAGQVCADDLEQDGAGVVVER
jgi:hypothetical protein